jgi:serine/threonine protein kinase
MITIPLVNVNITITAMTSLASSEERDDQVTKNHIGPEVVPHLPRIPKAVRLSDARLIGRGVHSEVYSAPATYKNQTITVALKFFSEQDWKERFEAELLCYEFLEHGSVSGVVPAAYGYDINWDYAKLLKTLGDSLFLTSPLRTPVSVLVLEYIADSVPLSPDCVNWRICKEIMRGLDLMHTAQVLHHDVGEQNILVVPSTGRAVWIDFPSSFVNPDDMEIWDERQMTHSLLYQHVVSCLFGCN